MVDVPISLNVTRPVGGDLNLNDLTNYYLSEFDRGEISWRKQRTTSPYIDGTFPVHSVLDQSQLAFSVWVKSVDTYGDLRARIEDMVNALSQRQFTITAQYGDSGNPDFNWTAEYLCEEANLQVGLETYYLTALYVPVACTVPYRPTRAVSVGQNI